MRLGAHYQRGCLRSYTRLMSYGLSGITIVFRCQPRTPFTSSHWWTIWSCRLCWKLSRELVLNMSRHGWLRMRWCAWEPWHTPVILPRKLGETRASNLSTETPRPIRRRRLRPGLTLVILVTALRSAHSSIFFSFAISFLPPFSLHVSSITAPWALCFVCIAISAR